MHNKQLHPLLAQQLPVMEGITKLFHPYVEAALHDLQSGTMVAIYNNISRRKVGEPSVVTKFIGKNIDEFPDVFDPYYKDNWDGRKFKCVSVTIRDEAGKSVGLVCFNFDTSAFGDVSANIQQLLAIGNKTAQSPVEQYTEDWRQRVNDCINNFLKENHATLPALTTDQKRTAVNRLYNHGLFNYRKAAAYVAGQLHVSRATVYNYLKEG